MKAPLSLVRTDTRSSESYELDTPQRSFNPSVSACGKNENHIFQTEEFVITAPQQTIAYYRALRIRLMSAGAHPCTQGIVCGPWLPAFLSPFRPSSCSVVGTCPTYSVLENIAIDSSRLGTSAFTITSGLSLGVSVLSVSGNISTVNEAENVQIRRNST